MDDLFNNWSDDPSAEDSGQGFAPNNTNILNKIENSGNEINFSPNNLHKELKNTIVPRVIYTPFEIQYNSKLFISPLNYHPPEPRIPT